MSPGCRLSSAEYRVKLTESRVLTGMDSDYIIAKHRPLRFSRSHTHPLGKKRCLNACSTETYWACSSKAEASPGHLTLYDTRSTN